MPISAEDAQQLYKSGNISKDTFNSIVPQPTQPVQPDPTVNYINTPAKTPQEALGLPANQPVLADNAGNILKANPIAAGYNVAKDILGGTNDSGGYSASQGYNLNIFENPNAKKMEDQVIKQTGESSKALEKIGEETKSTVAPVATEGQFNIQEQNARIQKFAEEAAQLTNNADAAQKNALDKISTLYNKGKIDPERYVREMGVSQKVMTGIGLVLSGMGSGLTGQPNLAMQVLQRNIDRDIESQKETIANDFRVAAQQLNISQQALNTAQIKGAITNLASALVNTGAAAAVEAAEKTVKAKTAQDNTQLLKQALLQNVGKYTLDFDNIHKSTIQGNQGEQYKLLTGALNNYGRYGTWYQPNVADLSKTPYSNIIQSESKVQKTPVTRPPVKPQPQVEQPKQEQGFLDKFLGMGE